MHRCKPRGAVNSYIRKSDNLAKISERGSVSRSATTGNDVAFSRHPFHPELLRVEDPRSFGSGSAALRTPRPTGHVWRGNTTFPVRVYRVEPFPFVRQASTQARPSVSSPNHLKTEPDCGSFASSAGASHRGQSG